MEDNERSLSSEKAAVAEAVASPRILTPADFEDESDPTLAITLAHQRFSSDDSFIGVVLSEKYEILRHVGSGGWADVYEARHIKLNRRVAVKVLYDHLARDAKTSVRFEREAKSSMRLSHSNVVAILDYDVLPNGRPFIVMEFVEGTTLSSLLKRRTKLPYKESLEIIEPICAALEQAHSFGVLHRDIKPSNIMLCSREGSPSGDVKLLDFGLSKSVEDEISATDTGVTVGTPAYMSPEQCRGDVLDGRSDIYSLGCVMFEMLTGRLPFVGKNTFEQMNLHIYENARFERTDDVPDSMQDIILRCLEKRVQDRFTSVSDVHQALRELPPEVAYQSRKGSARRVRFPQLPRSLQLNVLRGLNSFTVQILGAVGLLLVCACMFMLLTRSLIQEADSPGHYNADFASGESYLEKGLYNVALQHLKHAWNDLSTAPANDQRRLGTLNALRQAYAGQGNSAQAASVDEAIAQLEENYPSLSWGVETENAREIASLVDAEDDKSILRQAHLRNNQTQILLSQKRFEEAEQQCQKALAVLQKSGKTESAEYAVALSNMACVDFSLRKLNAAEGLYQQALDLRKKLLPAQDPLIAKSYRHLGDFYAKTQRLTKAAENLRHSLEILNGSGHDAELAWTANNLGLVYMQKGDYKGARSLLQQAFEIRKRIYPADSVEVARAEQNLGLLNMAEKNKDAARDLLQAALVKFESTLGPTDYESLQCAFSLSQVQEQCSDLAGARAGYKRICHHLNSKDPLYAAAAERLSKIGS